MVLPTSYDELPYPSLPYAQSHPDRLATVARLRGLDAAPVEDCRVLELGCAGGGNLIPMAYGLPGSAFVGIDYSRRQIGEGQETSAALGLGNVTWICADILDLGADLGLFDYIIAHGVLSWVSRPVQDKVLQICRTHLMPRGVAYISYNTYPGWHFFGAVREMMLYHTRNVTGLAERAKEAWAFLEMLAQTVPAESGSYGAFLHAFTEFLRGSLQGPPGAAEALLLHDELEEVNEPLYFHQFVDRAASQGLQYLGEAEFSAMVGGRLPSAAFEGIHCLATSTIDLEQYADFLSNRTFRQTLLCRREIELTPLIRPEQLDVFYLGSQAQPEIAEPDIRGTSAVRFQARSEAAISFDHPLTKAAMVVLADAWPLVISFGTLLARARARLPSGATQETKSAGPSLDNALDAAILGANLIKAYGTNGGLVELRTHAPKLAAVPSARPCASAVARYQARRGVWATNLRHERVVLDQFDRFLLPLLDGTHDLDSLVQETADGPAQQDVALFDDVKQLPDRKMVAAEVARRLQWLARVGLLEAQPDDKSLESA